MIDSAGICLALTDFWVGFGGWIDVDFHDLGSEGVSCAWGFGQSWVCFF
jgi:hypothetical protein